MNTDLCTLGMDVQGEMICQFDIDWLILYVNPAFLRFFNLNKEEVIGRSILTFDLGMERDQFQNEMLSILVTDKSHKIAEARFEHLNTFLYIEWSEYVLRNEFGEMLKYQIVGRNITKQVDLQGKIESERDFLRKVINVIPGFVSVKDEHGCFQLVNVALAEAYGTSVQEVEGKMDADFSPTFEEVENFRAMDMKAMETGESIHIPEETLTRADGKVMWLSTVKVPIIRENNPCSEILIFSNDITERKKMEEKLRYHAYYDTMTGLLNSYGFSMRVASLLENATAGSCFVLIDIRKMNAINSVYGAIHGDLILKKIGQILMLQEVSGNLYVRFSGDRFGIWMRNGSEEKILKMLHEVKSGLDIALVEEGKHHDIDFAVGYCDELHLHRSVDKMIQYASAALEYGKDNKNIKIQRFEDSLMDKLERRETLKSSIRQAIENEELTLYYQEKVDSICKEVKGVEGLARWKSPVLGFVSPIEFIPLFSQSKLIFDFTYWSLERAMRDLPILMKRYGEHVKVSVNISPLVIHTDDFYNKLVELSEIHHLCKDHFVLEITEDIFINNLHVITSRIKKIQEQGFLVSMDDFGSGYASLNHIIHMPFDEIKIDKSIIDLLDTKVGKIFVENIIAMSKELGSQVVAEGVETMEQADILRTLGCDSLQGYLYSKPSPLKEQK